MDPEALLADLNDEQRTAVTAVTGPVAILAGAGTGKTRVISRRAAYAVATDVVDAKRILIVTFTDKASKEMQHRLTALGAPQVQASTFHAAARRQLAYHWPNIHGQPLPDVLQTKIPIVAPLARSLPGGYKFTATKDLTDEIEWAKNRRIPPNHYLAAVLKLGRIPPIPADLFVTVYQGYENAKQRAGRIDFEDMLSLAVDLYEQSEGAIDLVRQRYTWFSVDEYQDTNPLQEALLGLWVGERRDLCVVGDEDQTIFGFTGASSDYLTTFGSRFPDGQVINLVTNYRSTPQVLDLANDLIRATGRNKALRAASPAGPVPTITRYADGRLELEGIVTSIRRHVAEGVGHAKIAILTRTNAQVASVGSDLTAAGIPFSVRGVRFYARPEVRDARAALRNEVASVGLVQTVLETWKLTMGFSPNQVPLNGGVAARDRHAALLALLAIAREVEAADPAAGIPEYLAELERRDDAEQAAVRDGTGVTLSTLHRAKGLEWEAVYLPMLEEGTLPISQSLKDPDAILEERRLLYVGITRARRYLALSWATRRTNAQGGSSRPKASRFVAELAPGHRAGQRRPAPDSKATTGPRSRIGVGDRVIHAGYGLGIVLDASTEDIEVTFDSGVTRAVPLSALRRPQHAAGSAPHGGQPNDGLLEALRTWRLERARADGVPAFVVADNKTLGAIAAAQPTDEAELLEIPGIGPSRLARYGDDILRVLRQNRV